MPRKVTKTAKPSLQFLERPLCGAKLQNVPEVRAALNARDFFTEAEAQSSSALNSWVRPQFDISVATAPPVRRGRRKCQSATSILDSCSQLSRKNSVCKFPQLLFKTGSKDQTQQPKGISKKKAIESTHVGRKPAEKKTVSAAQCSNLPKGQFASVRKQSAETFSDDTSSHQRCLAEPDRPSVQVSERCRIPAVCASTLPCEEFSTTEVCPPPDVDTPKAMGERNISPSTPCGHLLLAQPCTPPCNGSPDILVADTPERDYGMKVTWRRRKNLMVLLKQRGHLSEADALIQS
ncbi:RAD9, HUS1, RAD1-interacting nuclear orphan protein 1 [Pelmatolapia mariae]|uniref:RAD9, HUS1, RAD1-interacting nuclear orphan protein 1 n=1 Tax=Pelmatolapia mariae TaxID=158779 RepID=UPI002FE616D2